MREAVNPDVTRIPEQQVNARQIDSYDSRIKAERRVESEKDANKKGGKKCTRSKRAEDGVEGCEDSEDADIDEFDIDESVFKGEEFKSDVDLLVESVMNNLGEIFELNVPIELMPDELTEPNGAVEEVKPEDELFGNQPEKKKLRGKYGIFAANQDPSNDPSDKPKLRGMYGIRAANQNPAVLAESTAD